MDHNIPGTSVKPMDMGMARSLLAFKRREDEFEENVLDNIVSRIPFPFIFKARLLSRHWFSKFHLAARFRTSFHDKVLLFSHKWPAYCPAFVRIVTEPTRIPLIPLERVRDTRYELVGFDRESNAWKVFQKPDMPIPTRNKTQGSKYNLSVGGSLLAFSFKHYQAHEFKILLVNWVTGCWRHMQTPSLPGSRGSGTSCGDDWEVLIVPTGPCSYKIVVYNVVTEENDDYNLVYVSDHIYDSQTKIWTHPRTPINASISDYFQLSPYSVCVGNILFRLWIPFEATRKETKNSIIVMETDVIHGTSFETIFPGQRRNPTLFGGLFLCGSAVYMVLTETKDARPGSCAHEPGRRPPLDLEFIRSQLGAVAPNIEDLRARLAAVSSPNAIRARIYRFRPEISEIFPISDSPPHVTLFRGTTMAADDDSIYFIGPRVHAHEISGSKCTTRRFLSSFKVEDPRGGWSNHPPFPETRQQATFQEGQNVCRWDRFYCFHPGQNPFVMP